MSNRPVSDCSIAKCEASALQIVPRVKVPGRRSLCARGLIGEVQLESFEAFSVDGLPVSTAATLFDPPHRFLATTGEVSDTPWLVASTSLKGKSESGSRFFSVRLNGDATSRVMVLLEKSRSQQAQYQATRRCNCYWLSLLRLEHRKTTPRDAGRAFFAMLCYSSLSDCLFGRFLLFVLYLHLLLHKFENI